MRKLFLHLAVIVALVALQAATDKSLAQDMALKTNLLYDATTTLHLGYEVALGKKTTLDTWVNYNPWTLGHKWVGIEGATNELTEQRESKLKHFLVQPELRYWLCEKFNGHFFGVHLHGGIFNVGALSLPFDWGRYKYPAGENIVSLADGQPWGQYLGRYPVEMETATGATVTGVQYKNGTDNPYSGLVGKYGETYAKNQSTYSYADRDGIYINSFDGWLLGAGVSYGYHWILTTRLSAEFTIGVGYAYLRYEKSRCTDCKQSLEDLQTHYFGPTRAGISLVYMIK